MNKYVQIKDMMAAAQKMIQQRKAQLNAAMVYSSSVCFRDFYENALYRFTFDI